MAVQFHLLGFSDLGTSKILVFSLVLGIFAITLVGNVIIIVLVPTSHQLQSPMYFFLSHLATTDVLVSVCIVPFLLNVIYKDIFTISLEPCLFQLFLFCVSETVECFILTVMSYDRYLAICLPLRYNSVMNNRHQYHLTMWSWFIGTMSSISLTVQINTLRFCGSPVIDHFFCDPVTLIELSCSRKFFVKVQDLLISVSVTLFPFVFIFLTYVAIFVTIFRNPSQAGRQKAFSTCSAHLIVVTIFYGSLICVYGAPSSNYSANLNKGLSLIYTLLTPMCNPIIYSLRSREIRSACMQHIKRLQTFRSLKIY